MSPVDGRRPFQEIVEVSKNEFVREAASGEENKYKGAVNQVYTNELPSVLPEKYIKKLGYITTTAEYTTGTVTVGTGTTNIIGASTSWTSANSDDMWIKVDGADQLYRMTFSAGTSLTFQDSLTWVGSSGTGNGYTLFQDRYQLASDFAYIAKDDPEDPSTVFYYSGQSRLPLQPWANEEYERNFNGTTGTPSQYSIKWVSENPYVYVWPASSALDIIGYYYVPRLTSLIEYTTGTVTFTTGTAVVAAGSPTWSTSLSTGTNTYFIRNDADGTGSGSLWFQISTVANDTALTLSNAFTGTSGTGITYTISEISKWPERFDDAMLYKTCMIVDPDNAQIEKWTALYQEAIGLDLAVESKRRRGHTLKHFPGKRL